MSATRTLGGDVCLARDALCAASRELDDLGGEPERIAAWLGILGQLSAVELEAAGLGARLRERVARSLGGEGVHRLGELVVNVRREPGGGWWVQVSRPG